MALNKKLIGPVTLILGILTALFFGFQNCSQMNFENAVSTANQKAEGSFIVEPIESQGTTAVDEGADAISTGDDESEQTDSGAISTSENPGEQHGQHDGETADDAKDENDDYPVEAEHSETTTCNIEIADIMVNVLRVEALAHGGWITVQSDLGAKSLFDLAAGLSITSNKKLETNQIRLVLAEQGNYLKGVDGKEYKLTTPSGQESGLKVNLRGRTEFPENQSVLIKFHLDPGSQIQKSGNKCTLQPVFQAD